MCKTTQPPRPDVLLIFFTYAQSLDKIARELKTTRKREGIKALRLRQAKIYPPRQAAAAVDRGCRNPRAAAIHAIPDILVDCGS